LPGIAGELLKVKTQLGDYFGCKISETELMHHL